MSAEFVEGVYYEEKILTGGLHEQVKYWARMGEDQGRALAPDLVAEVDSVDRCEGHERSSRECAAVGEGAG